MVTHDPELARRAHRNVHMLDGQVTDFTEFDSALRMREERIAAMGA
jgi:putative ABC transport system ATP-binding protein